MDFDLLIKNAKTRASGKELLDLGIAGGKISRIGKNLKEKANQTIDANGKLVTESFVNGHLHLC
ncbi:MAG: cytosine deaminase, partial [Proteobacteria bacterium]|nr:cytosine deaminase [Pseudomonadota bacterium]